MDYTAPYCNELYCTILNCMATAWQLQLQRQLQLQLQLPLHANCIAFNRQNLLFWPCPLNTIFAYEMILILIFFTKNLILSYFFCTKESQK